MKRLFLLSAALSCMTFIQAEAQDLSAKMEELNAVQFKEAVKKKFRDSHPANRGAGKARPSHASRHRCLYSQINEAKHQPGTIAYSPELAGTQDGTDLDRISNLSHVYTGIWWYASYPNHYSGDGSKATEEAGKLILDSVVDDLVKVIREVKADTAVSALQSQYFDEAESPLDTKQPY